MISTKIFYNAFCTLFSCVVISNYYTTEQKRDFGYIDCTPSSKIIVDYEKNILDEYLDNYNIRGFEELTN